MDNVEATRSMKTAARKLRCTLADLPEKLAAMKARGMSRSSMAYRCGVSDGTMQNMINTLLMAHAATARKVKFT